MAGAFILCAFILLVLVLVKPDWAAIGFLALVVIGGLWYVLSNYQVTITPIGG